MEPTEPKRSDHPGLNSILRKLYRRESLKDDELQLLKRQIDDLRERAHHRNEEFETLDLVDTTTPKEILPGHATRAGSELFVTRFARETVSFYREAQGLLISSIGIGTYHGAMDKETDAAYADAIHAALQSGVNLIDTSLNYRFQRSERAVAAGLRLFIERTNGSRNEIVICTKAGYLVPGAITPGTLSADDVVDGTHSIAPAFLLDQLKRSLSNLGLETIDVYYLHNPETQLKSVGVTDFMKRLRAAFECLERAVSDGVIRYYGTATWSGFRGGGLSLRTLVAAGQEIAGNQHHFRFVQVPFNFGMQEALTTQEGGGSVLNLAAELGITVIASASLLQARLARDLPKELVKTQPGLDTDAQRAIQFTRSTPGITSALVGMRQKVHVAENLGVAKIPPLTPAEYQLYQSSVL